jgi:H+/Cl- antiporter ClcA
MGAASGGVLSGWFGLNEAQRRLVTACGAGAGLAAVYNVPLGGALFTIEVLIGSAMLSSVLPAMACATVATVTAWAYLPDRPTYLGVPAYHLSAGIAVFALVVGPFVAVVATAYIRLIGWVSYRRPPGRSVIVWMTAGFGALGLLGAAYPQLFGNGSDMATAAFLGNGSALLFLALFCLKPLATALCLRSGAAGGLFTPTMATGALLGAALGLAWGHLWAGSPVGAFALIGASAMIGASMQAPLAGVALVLELTRSGFNLVAPMMAATLVATAIARYLDGYSIYSARLPVEAPAS